MRRNERQITIFETLEIIENGEYGILSTVDENGIPYGVPLNYSFVDHDIYFHCAREGRKIDNIEKNCLVSFCIVGKTKVLPESFSTCYESVIVSGKVIEVFEEEKQKALENLIKKYSEDFLEKGMEYIEKAKDKTRTFKIEMDKFTGKARK